MRPYPQFAAVIVDTGIDKILDYGVPETLIDKIQPGMKVEVSLRGHIKKGYILKVKATSEYPSAQPVLKILSEDQLITPQLMELALWISKYYHSPLSHVIQIMLPSPVRQKESFKQQYSVMRGKTREELRQAYIELSEEYPSQAKIIEVMLKVNKEILLTELLEKSGVSKSPVDSLVKKGLIKIDIVRVDRSPLQGEEYFKTTAKTLNEEQKSCLESILKGIQNKEFQTHLLFGVTGSGKTEIYLQAIHEALRNDQTTLMLVPEISLTPQTIERFRSRFEGKIAILHHRLSKGERFDEWHKILRGEASIVIGARSAIFSPLPNLGLIIIDEEHDGAYKQQEDSPCYHARDIAVLRGKLEKCQVILGSATPSIESFYNAERGKYKLHLLTSRHGSSILPQVKIVDMRRELEKSKGFTLFSEYLIDAIKLRLSRGEQTILFLNRRGYHTSQLCQSCGKSIKCSHCDLTLTYHDRENILLCHLCSASIKPPKYCPDCKSEDSFKFKGFGTELVEKSLKALFPDIRVSRMDRDTTKHKGSHELLFRSFATGKSDVLVGTQMVAKGLHFPNVTLVAILQADAGLQVPDFRASENVFQVLTQVAGRAGRGSLKGEVIIQTLLPEHSTITFAAKQDYPGFYKEELNIRKSFGFPPFSHMVKCVFSSIDETLTIKTAETFALKLREKLPAAFMLFPISPSGHAKIKDLYRYQFIIKGPGIYPLVQQLDELKKNISISSKVKILIDIDPFSIFF